MLKSHSASSMKKTKRSTDNNSNWRGSSDNAGIRYLVLHTASAFSSVLVRLKENLAKKRLLFLKNGLLEPQLDLNKTD